VKRMLQNRVRTRASRLRAPQIILSAAFWVLASGLSCTSQSPEAPFGNPIPRFDADLVNALATAYRLRDLGQYEALLAPEYQFYLAEPTPDGTTVWGRTEELAIHQRLFHPEQSIPPPDAASWVTSIEIQCTLRTRFEPLECLIPEGCSGPDPLHWRLTQAHIIVSMTLHNKDGSSNHTERLEVFVVIDDRTKQSGEPGKYRLYRRVDLGPNTSAGGAVLECAPATPVESRFSAATTGDGSYPPFR
jgi:hypothetical protein